MMMTMMMMTMMMMMVIGDDSFQWTGGGFNIPMVMQEFFTVVEVHSNSCAVVALHSKRGRVLEQRLYCICRSQASSQAGGL